MKSVQFCYDTLEKSMSKLYEQVEKNASTNTVLVSGKSGSGKESICRLLHEKGASSDSSPYLAINCSAIPQDLIEAELFGFEAGAFSGATEAKQGKLTQAHEGTLVLDEIGELDLKNQTKLLRVLESREFHPLGSNVAVKLTARIIATTNKNLADEVKNGRFRQDLFYRLDVMRLHVPGLNERPRDIPVLVDYFLKEFAKETGKNLSVSPEVYHVLCQRKWDGNIRELKNFVTRLFYLTTSTTITANDLTLTESSDSQNQRSFVVAVDDISLHDMEKKFILHTMHRVAGNKSKAARFLKISLKTLRNKLKEYDYQSLPLARPYPAVLTARPAPTPLRY